MDSPRSNLLQAAKAFIAKSTKAAAVNVPLALATVPTEAEAQVVFGPMTLTSASAFVPSGSAVFNYTASSSFSKSLSLQNGLAGQQFGANYTFTNLPTSGPGLEAHIQLYSDSGSSGELLEGTEVAFAYQFSLSASSGVTLHSLSINANLISADDRRTGPSLDNISDFSSGTFSGSGSFISNDGWNDRDDPIYLLGGSWLVELTIHFSAAATTDTLNIAMGPSEGFAFGSNTLSAIPEPSTYALLLGLTALGYVAYRRRRAA